MSFLEWKEVKLEQTGLIITGKTPSSKTPDHFGELIPFVTPTDFKNYHKQIYSAERYLSQKGKEGLKGKVLPKNTVLVTCIGSDMGKVALSSVECVTNQQINSIIPFEEKSDANFLFYKISNMNEYLKQLARGGTTMPIVNKGAFEQIIIQLPSLPEQKAIAGTLSCLDDKIELNNRINKTLEEMAQAIFKSWFVDFEPFQEGEFVDSEMGRIPKGWKVGTLGDIIELFDSKRIPLSSRKRETMQKIYPYYGATSLMDYVEDYIFEGIYVLLGEDGTVIDSDGYPILQYVWGKFWVNNHAHILKGKNGFNEDSVYMMLKNTNVQEIVTGAVQLKINQANLKSVKMIIPALEGVLKFNYLLEPLFSEKRRIFEEGKILKIIRDTLLPKLMSGEIRVPTEEVQ